MVVLLGKSASGKNSLVEALMKDERLDYIDFCTECTTRPMREYEIPSDNLRYDFITNKEFNLLKTQNKLIAEFNVNSRYGVWQYGILRRDVRSNVFIITNPTNFYQLKMRPRTKLYSIYLDVDERTRMSRMINRSDDITEIYRRIIHDEGHFSGIEKYMDLIINDSTDVEDVVKFILEVAPE